MEERGGEHADRNEFRPHQSYHPTERVLARESDPHILQPRDEYEVYQTTPQEFGDMGPDPLKERAFAWGDVVRELAVRGGKEGDKDERQKRAEKLEPGSDGKEP
ncbi:MAG: hypothetical protein ACE5FB_04780 [Candidatus Binatia bacterium]